MSITEKALSISTNNTTIAENEQKVYDAGKQKEKRAFWERITGNGQRTNYNNTFRNTDFTGEIFPKDLFTIKNSSTLFYNYYGTHLPQGIGLSQINPNNSLDTSHAYNIIGNSPKLEEVYDWKMPAMLDYYYSFHDCAKLRKIAKIKVVKESTFVGAFQNLPMVEEIGFEGVIGTRLELNGCPKLSHDTLLNVINCLYNYSGGTTHVLALGTTNLAKLTDAEKAVATQKGWTLT